MKALGNKVLVKLIAEEIGKDSLIVIPDAIKEEPQIAEVVLVGKNVEEIKEGDKIFFMKYTGIPFSKDGEEYKILMEPEVFLVL